MKISCFIWYRNLVWLHLNIASLLRTRSQRARKLKETVYSWGARWSGAFGILIRFATKLRRHGFTIPWYLNCTKVTSDNDTMYKDFVWSGFSTLVYVPHYIAVPHTICRQYLGLLSASRTTPLSNIWQSYHDFWKDHSKSQILSDRQDHWRKACWSCLSCD